jgi:ABC-type nitrate/sulfonate/bicarbonate transport system substrate-binding protein
MNSLIGIKSLFGALAMSALSLGAANAEELIPLRIGAASNVLFGPVFVLSDPSNGIAAKHGLEVNSRIFNSGIATMEAAMAGDLDVAFPNTRVLLPLLHRGDACFKAGIAFVDVNTVRMIATTDIKVPEDLKGRKVGTRNGGIGEVALHMWLQSKGIDRSEVEVVNLAEEDQPIALANGNVDAIIWPEPIPSIALQIGGDKVHNFGDISEGFRDTSVVNVTCDWATKYGDAGMEKVVAAFIDAVEYLKTNPQEGINLTAKALQLEPADVEKFWAQGGWPAGWPANLADGQVDMFEMYVDYLNKTGDLTERVDFSKWVSSKWLQTVAPDRVKLEKHKL